MTINKLMEKINASPDSIDFTEVIETIEVNYSYTPTRFINGIGENSVINEAGTNEG